MPLLPAATVKSSPQSWRSVAPIVATFADLLTAATALANRLPLCTRNPDDFDGLGRLIEIIGA